MNQSEFVQWVLSLDDVSLASLYSEWSEDTYAAGWLSYGPPLFARAVLDGSWHPAHSEPQADYEREGVAEIRQLLEKGGTE